MLPDIAAQLEAFQLEVRAMQNNNPKRLSMATSGTETLSELFLLLVKMVISTWKLGSSYRTKEQIKKPEARPCKTAPGDNEDDEAHEHKNYFQPRSWLLGGGGRAHRAALDAARASIKSR